MLAREMSIAGYGPSLPATVRSGLLSLQCASDSQPSGAQKHLRSLHGMIEDSLNRQGAFFCTEHFCAETGTVQDGLATTLSHRILIAWHSEEYLVFL
jgi:hypothetical protein